MAFEKACEERMKNGMEHTDILTNDAEKKGEEMYRAFSDGASFEALGEMMNPAEDSGEAEEAVLETEGTAENENEPEEAVQEETKEEKPEPYRVYETKEDFQKHFDHEWNKRYGSMRTKMTEQERTLEETNGLLADLLGVSKENALSELRKRRYALEAEDKGYSTPEQYVALKEAQEEIARLKRQNEETAINQSVAEIRRQGAALSSQVKSFDLDAAMGNELFRETVFTLHRAGAKDAVERAFRAVYFDEYLKNSQAQPAKEAVVRPKEGGSSKGVGGNVKPVNVAGFSGDRIKELEKRILRGEKIDFNHLE